MIGAGWATLTYTTCLTAAALAAAIDARALGPSTARNCVPFQGDGFGTPTSCTSVSCPRTDSANVSACNGLPTTTRHPAGTFFADAARTNAVTSWPRSSNKGRSRDPRYPVAPVRKTRCLLVVCVMDVTAAPAWSEANRPSRPFRSSPRTLSRRGGLPQPSAQPDPQPATPDSF